MYFGAKPFNDIIMINNKFMGLNTIVNYYCWSKGKAPDYGHLDVMIY